MSVYVGIDVHRKRSQVAVVTEDGTVQLNKNVVNGSEPFLRLIGDLPAGTPVAFEAAFGWSWLAEALDTRVPGYALPSGTVTRVITEGFGAKQDELPLTGFELRASWSPPEDTDLGVNVAAWCDLLAAAAGLPTAAPGTQALRSASAHPGGPRPGRRRYR